MSPVLLGRAAFRLPATVFDGTNDYMNRGAALVGAVDGGKGLIEAWLRIDGGAGVVRRFFNILNAAGSSRLNAYCHTTNGLIIQGTNAAGSTLLDIRSVVTPFTAAAAFVHVLVSWDLSDNAKRHILINAVSSFTASTYTSGNVELSGARVGIGADNSGFNKFPGAIGRLVFDPEYLDLSVAANVAKFIRNGKPVSLGPGGQKVFGRPLMVLMRNPYSSFHINSGTGGDFTVVGSLDPTDGPR